MAPGIVVFLFGLVTVVFSLRMPIGTFRNPGSGLFPLCLGILLMLLSALFFFQIYVKHRPKAKNEIGLFGGPSSVRQVVLFFGAIALATLLFKPLGYPLMCFLLMFALLKILGVKGWIFSLVLSLLTSVASYFLFVQGLKIPLPKGWIGL